MHSRRALYALVLLLLALGQGDCEEKIKWYSGLQGVLTNCPPISWNSTGQEEPLEKFRQCIQQRALTALDSLLADDVIPVFDGLDLIRFQGDRINVTENYSTGEEDESNWTNIIFNRVLRVLRSHVFRVDVDHLVDTIRPPLNNSRTHSDDNGFVGRRRRHRRRHNNMMSMMMMGAVLMGSVLIPMGFQFLAVLGGKALLLAKMALILSSIQGLKRIATNGMNYGLYHAPPVEGWNDRSGQPMQLDFDLNNRPYLPTRP